MKGPLGLVDLEKIRNDTIASLPYTIGIRTSQTIQSAMTQVFTEAAKRRLEGRK